MKLADLKIDPDFKNLLPELDAETYTNLEKDIVTNGMFDPIITWNGFIADGHNRYEICKAHRIEEVQTKELSRSTKSEVMQWIVEHQYARRILLKSEKVKVLLKVEEQIAKEAKDRQGTRNDLKNIGSNLTQGQDESETGRTAEIMAKKMEVSKNTWKDMKTVVTQGTPEKIQRMDQGGRGNSPSAIANEIREGIPDGYRKCTKCGVIKKIEFFKRGEKDGTYRTLCKDCYNKDERRRNAVLQVMPDTLNPDVKEEITDDIIIDKFANILADAESSFRMLLKYETKMTNAIREALVVTINEHMGKMNILKGEIENETEGQNI